LKAVDRIRTGTWAFLALCLFLVPCRAQESPGITQMSPSPPEKIARELRFLINRTRSEHGLPPLAAMAALEKAAEAHSRDMAKLRLLTHISASGLSYTERLKDAGVFFEAAGENVAKSETFIAEFIHESLMDSPEHRVNILSIDFNRVGIGVVFTGEGGYYITQDFLRSSGPEPVTVDLESHLRELAGATRERINTLRQRKGLEPLIYLEEASALAEQILERRAAGLPLPILPPSFRKLHILYDFVTAPSLALAESKFNLEEHARARTGSLALRYSRSKDYPGGAYDFVLMLFLEDEYAYIGTEELTALIENQITVLRGREGLREIPLDTDLSDAALRISRSLLNTKGRSAGIPERLAGFRIESYVTSDPLEVPDKVASRIAQPGIRRLGLGIVSEKVEDLPTGRFWITLVFR
jgi:uncharacterized protein YkwD